MCDACAVFGSTGRKRLFRIDWEHPENSAKQAQLQVKVNSNRGWFLRRGLLLKNMAGRFIPVRQSKDISFEELQQILALTLCLIADWGGLGAKTQQGYGLVCLKEIKPPFDLEKALAAFDKLLKTAPERRQTDADQSLPGLDKFFFIKIRFQKPDNLENWILSLDGADFSERWSCLVCGRRGTAPNNVYHRKECKGEVIDELKAFFNHNILPVAPVVRYHLRQLFKNRWPNSKPFRHQMLGKIQGEVRQKSIIHVSHAYLTERGNYEFRIWGWMPQEVSNKEPGKSLLSTFKDEWLNVKKPDAGILWDKEHCNFPVDSIEWKAVKDKEAFKDFLRTLFPD